MKPTKQPPTINEIEREFDEEFSINPEIMGGKMIFGADKVKQFYRQKITEMLEWLRIEPYRLQGTEELVKGGLRLREASYNQAVDELNRKINQLKEQ